MELKKYRKNKGYTQKQIATMINVAPTTYLGYEKETSEPSIDTLSKLADIYNISIDFLVGRTSSYHLPTSATVKQKDVVNLVLGLNDKNCERVEFFIAGLLAGEKDQAKTINKFGGK